MFSSSSSFFHTLLYHCLPCLFDMQSPKGLPPQNKTLSHLLLSSQLNYTAQPHSPGGQVQPWKEARGEKHYFQVWPTGALMSFSALFPLTGWMNTTQRTSRRADSKPQMKNARVLAHFVNTSIELYVIKIEFFCIKPPRIGIIFTLPHVTLICAEIELRCCGCTDLVKTGY